MRAVIAIATVNLRRLFRQRSTIFFVFIFPLLLVLLIGIQFGGGLRPQLGVSVASEAGPLGTDLVDRLEAADVFDLVRFDRDDELADAVSRGRVDIGVAIPAGYDADIRSGGTATLGVVTRPDGSGFELRAPVDAVVAEQSAVVRAARLAAAEQGIDLDTALERATTLATVVPEIGVETTRVGTSAFEDFDQLGQFDLGASSQLLLFVFLTSLSGSSALIQSRQWGISRRELSTPTRAIQVVAGEALGRFLIAAVQAAYIAIGTALIFGVSWGDPLAATVLVLSFCLVSAGAAMLLGAVLDNDAQAGGIGVFLGLGLAALGGSMAPPEVFSEGVRRVAHLITPHIWANDAFAELVRHGGGIGDILPELAVLLGSGVVLLAASGWLLRRSVVGSGAAGS